jgi:N-acetylglucosaminyl-diphospho-decaprenol L-rhamnosyltransferase
VRWPVVITPFSGPCPSRCRRQWQDLGGFCEQYTGYGAEDTDFGQVAASRGIGLTWVGGAWAYHQHHPTSDPPVQHLHDILRNAAIFHRRWGWWPMSGWLQDFARQGLIRFEPGGQTWQADRLPGGNG